MMRNEKLVSIQLNVENIIQVQTFYQMSGWFAAFVKKMLIYDTVQEEKWTFSGT